MVPRRAIPRRMPLALRRTLPTGNLLLSILNKFDVDAKSFGDSTGPLEGV